MRRYSNSSFNSLAVQVCLYQSIEFEDCLNFGVSFSVSKGVLVRSPLSVPFRFRKSASRRPQSITECNFFTASAGVALDRSAKPPRLYGMTEVTLRGS